MHETCKIVDERPEIAGIADRPGDAAPDNALQIAERGPQRVATGVDANDKGRSLFKLDDPGRTPDPAAIRRRLAQDALTSQPADRPAHGRG